MRTRVWWSAAIVLVLLATTEKNAKAHDGSLGAAPELGDPTSAEPSEPSSVYREQAASPARPKRSQRGTHFIGEARVGATLDRAGTLAYGGVLGVGGRWYGLPPIYLIGAIDHSSTGRATRDGIAFERLSLTRVGAGLRLYVPIAGPFRLMGDITVGAASTHASYEDGTTRVSEDVWLAYTELGVGPQFRVLPQLSLGARASIAFVDPSGLERGGPASAWESDLTQRTTALGTVTLHF